MKTIDFKKSDLLFLTQLDIKIELYAIKQTDESRKRFWQLKVKAINNSFIQEGLYYGARGEVRRFYQLNALFDSCIDIFGGKCASIAVLLNLQ